jgi:serine/threonine protein kinase/tetratricopeptide (TPR) repeat protein
MGVVYEVFDEERQELVALKVMKHDDPAMLYRFKHEFRALATASHPNLIRLYELISTEEQWFFTMELLDGADFVKHVRKEDPPWSGLRTALRQLVDGVRALHASGHLHRDIKPSNVLVTNDGRVVVLDFGLIVDLGPGAEVASTTHHLVGTPSYMAPEQAALEPLTEAADWYSVGVLLYESLTGHVPFSRSSATEESYLTTLELESSLRPRRLAYAPVRNNWAGILAAKSHAEPPAPGSIADGIPEDLDQICVGLLRKEPQARLDGQAVLRRLNASPPQEGVDSAAAPARSSSTSGPPFVGRASQLEALKDALNTVRRGEPVVVFVQGMSGMGKTALLRHFLDDLPQRNRLVLLEGRCHEQESVPYKALDAVVDGLSHYLENLPPVEQAELMPRDVGALAQVFQVLGRIPVVASAPRLVREAQDPHTLRRQAFAALGEILARIGDRRLLAVCIDDVQWGDVDSAIVLGDMLQPPDPPNLLLLMAYRSEDADRSPFVKRLLLSQSKKKMPDRDWRVIRVDPLSPDETRKLARTLLATGAVPVADEVVDQIVDESGNHPYFVNELVKVTQTESTGSRAIGSATRISLNQMLQSRLGRLPSDARQLLDTVVVAGRPVLQDVAFEAARLTKGGHAALDFLKQEHFVKSAGMRGTSFVEPFHDRIREARIEQISDRRIHHLRLAEALERGDPVDPEVLAVHFEGAGNEARAGHYCRIAADRAASALAFDRAARLYARSLELLRPTGEETRALKARLAEAMANAGRGAEAATHFLAAAEGASSYEALKFQRLAAEHLLACGHMDEGLQVAQRVLSTVDMRLPRSPRGALFSLLKSRLLIRLRGLGFRERDLGEIPPRLLTIIDTCWSMALGLAVVDNIRGADFQARHLLLALRAGEPYRVARALAMEAGFYAVQGGPTRERSARLTEKALALAQKTGNPHALGLAILTSGMAAYLVGQWRRAAELCEKALEILREGCVGVTWEVASGNNFLTSALVYLGEIRQLSHRVPALLDDAVRRGNLYARTNLRTRMGHYLWLAADEPEASREEINAALSLWTQKGFHLQHYSALFALAETELYVDQGVAALGRVCQMWGPLKRSLLLRVQMIGIEALHMRARCAIAACHRQGESKRVLRMAERDAHTIERTRMAWATPLATLLRAGVASRRGDTERAAGLLAEAVTGCDRAEMALFAAASRRQLGTLTGGAKGRDLVQQAEAWMSEQTIKNPARMSAMLVPGVVP